MEEMEERLIRLEYHQQLLLKMLKGHTFPVYEVIIKNGLSEEEVEEVFTLCEEFSKEFEKQKKAGYVHFDSLLKEFTNRLNIKIRPHDLVIALYEQNLYLPLMTKFNELFLNNYD